MKVASFELLEEIDLIRKKFNSIVDIPCIKENDKQNYYIKKNYPDNSEVIEMVN